MDFKKQLKQLGKQTWIIGMLSFIILLLSCAKNSEEMNLKGVLDYKWNTSIEDIEKDFNKKKYSEIEISKAENQQTKIEQDSTFKLDYVYAIVSDYIYSKMNYNGLPASIEIDYFNKQMFRGIITISKLKEDKVTEIKEKTILEFKEKYGEPQVTEEETIWKFKNNFSLEVSSYCSSFEKDKCDVYIIFLNNTLREEEKAASKQKIDEIKEKRRLAEEEKRKKEDAENRQWLEDNKGKIKEKLKGKLTISSDEFTGAKWINSTYEKIGSILEKLYLYIAITGKNKDVSLRMKINHKSASSDRMLNFSAGYEFNIDGEQETLKDIANSKKTIVRFEGELYYKDIEISQKEKEGMETIFLAYEYLKRGGSLKDIL